MRTSAGMNKNTKVQQLKEQEDIKVALKQTTGTKEAAPKPVVNTTDKLWFVTYILIVVGLLSLIYLLGSDLVPAETTYIPTLQRVLTGVLFIVLALALTRSIQVYLISQVENRPAQFNLTRVLNLLTVL